MDGLLKNWFPNRERPPKLPLSLDFLDKPFQHHLDDVAAPPSPTSLQTIAAPSCLPDLSIAV